MMGGHGLARPWESLHIEALAWFDHWLKGKDTGILDGPRFRYVIPEADGKLSSARSIGPRCGCAASYRRRCLGGRSFVIQAPFATEAAARIAIDIKSELFCRNLQTDIIVKFLAYFGESLLKEIRVQVRDVTQRKVQIFREAVRLEIAFLKACSALERPGRRQCFVTVDAFEEPAQDVVLLDNLRSQPKIGSDNENFAAVNQLSLLPASNARAAKAASVLSVGVTRPWGQA